jgi:hypothetical protein
MDAGPVLVDVLGNRRLGGCGFEKFQRRLPHRYEARTNMVRGHFFRDLHLEAERVAIKGKRRVHVLDCNSHVVETRNRHASHFKALRKISAAAE